MNKTTLIFSKKQKPVKSEIYDTYWRFAFERQNIFFNRFNGASYPWTEDEILNEHKFTNVYRASDRVSQFLIKNVIYSGDQSPEEVFFRIILFKTFNRISTWQILEDELGIINFREFSFEKYDEILSLSMGNKIPIYSGAYIMASGRSFFNYTRKHQNHLKLIELMIKEKVPDKLQKSNSMEDVFNLLLTYPTIGDFLAFQYAIDINYSMLTNFNEMDFVCAGPGAKDGIVKCFESFGDYKYEDIIRMMADDQERAFEGLDLNFQTLWGRRLQLIDCQNIFCEVDKYSRVAHPEISGLSNRARIKQKFTNEIKDPIDFFLPPKWGLNHLISKR